MSTDHTDALRELTEACRGLERIDSMSSVDRYLKALSDAEASLASPAVAPADERAALDAAFTEACKRWKNVVTTGEVSRKSAPFYFTLFEAGWSARASLDQPHSGETPT